jgi:hypothetical protein
VRKSALLAFALIISTVCSASFAAVKKPSSSTLTYQGSTYTLSSSSTCLDGTAALRYNRKWWCKVVAPTTDPVTTTTPTTTTPTAPTTYSAQLSWSAPSTRADGTPLALSDLAGYEIYYTTDDPAVSRTITVSGSAALSYTLSDLSAGNYYFAMAAIDTTGLKSDLSAIAPIKVGP